MGENLESSKKKFVTYKRSSIGLAADFSNLEKINPHLYGQMIFDKEPKSFNSGKTQCF